MKNNDIYFDEIPNVNENKLKIKSNSILKKEYKNIFLCPLNKNDCVNSIDIYDDIVLYGTIMGNVYLCRVNQNNLYQNKNDDKRSNNKEINNSKLSNKESSKISCIKLNTNNNFNSSNNNNYVQYGNETLRTNKEDKKEDKKEEEYFESDIIPTTKSAYINARKQEILTKPILLNIKENQNQNNNKLEKSIKNNSAIKSNTEEIIPFPQVTQLILNANENVPCVSFDTNDKVNLSIGDFEIIRLENMSTFNINDDNSNYNYIRIRNYTTENDHIKNCENSTCMMTNKYYLIVHTNFADNVSPITLNKISYENKMMTSFEVVKGEIEMYNFSIPFDFDGDRFLFLDYESEEIRRICIYYTLSKKKPYIYKITTDFGHISYMKLLINDKIILCKNHKFCEIHKIDDNFRLLEYWVHDGNEIIAMNIYIEGTKEDESYFDDSYTNLSFRKYNENESQTIELNVKKQNNFKTKNKYNHVESIYAISPKNNNPKRKPFEKDKFNNSTFRELNLNNKKTGKKNNVHLKYDTGDKQFNFNYNSDIENKINNKFEKEDMIEIYTKNKTPSIKGNELINKNKKKKIHKIINEDNFHISDKELIDRNMTNNNNYIQDKNKPTERSFYKNEKKIYILTVDLNGNFNVYHNNKNKTIFNLYNIKNIDKKYKEEEFFSLGFPYYAIMNSKYFAISTDHGIFVLSNRI